MDQISETSTELALEILDEDGVHYIRIDNRAKTDLGRMLDSQYILPFEHPELGVFNTTEGFWYYLSMEHPSDLLRVLNGHECRKLIKDLKAAKQYTKVNVSNFFQHIQYANYLKIEASPRLKKLFIESTLPFKIYYIRKTKEGKCIIHNTSYLHPRLKNLVSLREHYQRDPEFKMIPPTF